MSEIPNGNNITHAELLKMTTQVVSAFLGRNELSTSLIPDVVQTVFSSLKDLGAPQDLERSEPLRPATPVKKSVTPDYLICLEDGKKLKMLKRHLRSVYNMTPEEYRAKWGLPSDYPMVAPNYAKERSEFAKQIGLGRADMRDEAARGGRRKKNAA